MATMMKEIADVEYAWKGTLANPILAMITGNPSAGMKEGKHDKLFIIFLDEILDNTDNNINWKKTIDMVINEKVMLKLLLVDELEGASIIIFVTVKQARKVDCFMTRFYNPDVKCLEGVNKDMKNLMYDILLKEQKKSSETYVIGLGRGALAAMDLTTKAGPKIKIATFIQPRADLSNEVELFRDLAKMIYTKIIFVTNNESLDHASTLSEYKCELIAPLIDKEYKDMVICIDWQGIDEKSANREDWKEIRQNLCNRQFIMMNNKLSEALKINGVQYNELINSLPDFLSFVKTNNPRDIEKMRRAVEKTFINEELKMHIERFLTKYEGKMTNGIVQDNGGNKNFFFVSHEECNRSIWASKGNLPRNTVINNGQRISFTIEMDDYGRPNARNIKLSNEKEDEEVSRKTSTPLEKGRYRAEREKDLIEKLENEVKFLKSEINEIKERLGLDNQLKTRSSSSSGFMRSPSSKRQKGRVNLFSRD